jgi:hypothetical protein
VARLDAGWIEQRDYLSDWFSNEAVGIYPGKPLLPGDIRPQYSQMAWTETGTDRGEVDGRGNFRWD